MNKIILPLIILVIATLLLVVFVIRPIFWAIKQDSVNLISQRGALGDFENKSRNLKNFQASYDDYQTNLAKIDQLFVDQEEPIGFIEFLEGEAGNNHLTIDITPLTVKEIETDPWPSISFRLSLEGSFPNFLAFLGRVESSPYLITISSFNLKKPADSPNDNIAISFQIKAYTQ